MVFGPSWSETAIQFANFARESDMVFDETAGVLQECINFFFVLIPNK